MVHTSSEIVATEIYLTQISKTRDSLIVRENTRDDYDQFLELRESISRNGLIQPIVVRPLNNRGSYEVVAGNRRYEAVKQLEWRKIPAVVQDVSDINLRRMAFVENVYREDLTDVEKARNIAAIYQDIGVPPQQSIRLVKYLHNNPNILRKPSLAKPTQLNTKTELIAPTQEFIDAYKDIGIPANSQYKYLQLIVQLDEDVLDEAEKEGMPLDSKVMLTHPTLKKKGKKTQKKIIQDVKGLKGSRAKQRIREHIKAEEKDEELEERPSEKARRDLYDRSMDIGSKAEKLIALIIDRPLSRGQVFYTREIIDEQKDQIFALITALGDTRQLDSFDEQIEMLSYTIKLVTQNIQKVRNQNERKRPWTMK